MIKDTTKLSNPISTGGGGTHFENRVQASFTVLMLVGGFVPCLSFWPISKIKLQGKYQGFDTDDLIVYTENPNTKQQNKFLGQIKSKIAIREGDRNFCEVIAAAWHDFNSAFFNQEDAIALICGSLSETDTNDGRALLEQARYSENAADFIQRINLAKFTSEKQRAKLRAFKLALKQANENNDLADEELWRFLKSFHILIYDLDVKGIVLALLHTIINQFSYDNAPAIWAQIQDYVERVSEHAGYITKDTIPDSVKYSFKGTASKYIPEGFIKHDLALVNNWGDHSFANEILAATLIGEWNEKYPDDKEIISQFVGEDYDCWIAKIREVLQSEESIFTFADSVWEVKNRKQLLELLSPRIFDNNLDSLKQTIIKVLSELDPQFELPKGKRYIANIYGKAPKYSSSLRKGLAEGLTLTGFCSNLLINCSENKGEIISALTIREVFNNADWILWASISDVLPLLAEANPEEFLAVCESTLERSPCPFEILFTQEESGIFGRNYLTGLLWALEALAWKEEYLVRVTLVLGGLAEFDPGGNWANRPINSLSTIFLPWYPQTTASVEKRKVAIQTLNNEAPDIAWKLILKLLPSWSQTTTGSNKPVWRDYIPNDWAEGTTVGEYNNQLQIYADFAAEISKNNISYLIDLVEYLNKVPSQAFDKIIGNISSEAILALSEDARLPLWNELIKYTKKNEKHADADWALDALLLSRVKEVAKKVEPKNPTNLYYPLFNEYDYILYESDEEWSIQTEHLNERRQQAIKAILDYGGIDAVIELTQMVERPDVVGCFLGMVVEKNFDEGILPELLLNEDRKISEFAYAYVESKQRTLGWEWVDRINFKDWTISQVAAFFAALPFNLDTWQRVNKKLHNDEKDYWQKVYVSPYRSAELDYAIDKLIEYNRPKAAIDCIYRQIYDKEPFNENKASLALFGAITSKENMRDIDSYHFLKVISALQESKNVDEDMIRGIEWSYLPLILSGDNNDVRPKFLEIKLSTEPQFFCEVISKCYRPKNNTESEYRQSDSEKTIAENAWRLLHNWHTPPGVQDDGSIDSNLFNDWLEDVKKISIESGHIEVALTYVGHVLYYCPADHSGFWINKNIAYILNQKDSDLLRNGLYTETINSRGMHSIDPTGKPEIELAVKYRERAEETENAGYQRLALTFRKLAASYEREAQSIINEHKQ